MREMLDLETLVIDHHITPYTDVPDITRGQVRLHKTRYPRGFYAMENVKGYEFFRLRHALLVTNLQFKFGRRWQTLMVDDPMHWLGMEELATLAKPGEILVVGLGPGLILHHLVKRPDITGIKVIEVDPEVVELVRPYIPPDERIEIVIGDFFPYILQTSERFSTAILDIWVIGDKGPWSGEAHRGKVREAMKVGYALALEKADDVLVWGIRGYKLKSSVPK